MTKAMLAVVLAALPVIGSAQETVQQTPQTPPGQEAQTKAPATDGDAAKPAAPPAQTPVAVDAKTFVIGAEDQIQVDVWADPRIGGPVLVRPDGRISLNLLGDIQAAGRTPVELGNDIAEALRQKDVLRKPQVTVKVLVVNSKKYRINGEVMKTGAFPLVVPTRIMDALVEAGGFRDFANKKDIVIIRGSERLKFNWNEVVKGKKTEQNIFLQHGDIIIVK